MKKIKFGKSKTKLGQGSFKDVREAVEAEATLLDKIKEIGQVEHQQEVRTGLILPPEVKETIIVETRTVERVNTVAKDKLARKHSRLSRKKTDKALDDVCDILKTQNETIAELRSRVKKLSEVSDSHGFAINAVRMEKPKEIPVVTEKTVIEKHVSKKLVYALIGSVLLNALILLIK